MPTERVPIRVPPKLLDRVRIAARRRHLSHRTEESYVAWARRFIRFHGRRHPQAMGATEVVAFLSHLAVDAGVGPTTQNQALAALVFLYRHVLAREEVRSVLSQLDGTKRLQATLLYGGGLRLLECLRLRVKDLDASRGQLTVRQGKGRRDRVTTLPRRLHDPLKRHLAAVRDPYRRDLAEGSSGVTLPDALARKYPSARREWAWPWVFPAPAW